MIVAVCCPNPRGIEAAFSDTFGYLRIILKRNSLFERRRRIKAKRISTVRGINMSSESWASTDRVTPPLRLTRCRHALSSWPGLCPIHLLRLREVFCDTLRCVMTAPRLALVTEPNHHLTFTSVCDDPRIPVYILLPPSGPLPLLPHPRASHSLGGSDF